MEYRSSAFEYKQYNKRAVPGGFILLGGLTAGVVALINVKKQTHFLTPYSIAEFGLIAIGVPIMESANKHLRRSVKLYNNQVLNRN